jgi:hypothetical protein
MRCRKSRDPEVVTRPEPPDWHRHSALDRRRALLEHTALGADILEAHLAHTAPARSIARHQEHGFFSNQWYNSGVVIVPLVGGKDR